MDTRLSMGGRSSPGIFDTLPRAVEWICKYNYDLQWLCHLLDDFLSAEPVSLKGHSISTLKNVFALLGIPIAPGKIEGPCTTLEFLGITLDTVLFEARLSTEKVNKLGDTLTSVLGKKKCSKRELLSLVGSLSFACKVVVPGRAFLSRMISLSYSVHELHHKVYLNKQVTQDIHLWKSFIEIWNGKNFFLDKTETSSDNMHFFTDAAGTIGYGGYFQGAWFCKQWEEVQLSYCMTSKELYPIAVAVSLWGPLWSGKRIMVHCDNEGAVKALNKSYSNKPTVADIIRHVTFVCMKYNFILNAIHIPGKQNIKADMLSRFQVKKFLQTTPEANLKPENVALFHIETFKS